MTTGRSAVQQARELISGQQPDPATPPAADLETDPAMTQPALETDPASPDPADPNPAAEPGSDLDPDTGQPAEEDGDGDVDITDLHQLAEAIGVEPEFLYNLQIPVANGEPVTLGQFKDKLQEQGDLGGEAARLQTERELFLREKQEWEQQARAQAQQLGQVPQEVQNAAARVEALALQYQSIDWESLEKQDAGKAALHKQNLQTAYNQAQQELMQTQQQAAQIQQAQMAETRRAEEQKLLLAIDEWRDPKKRESGVAAVTSLMAEYGFAPEEIGNVIDHRAIRIMHDLVRLRAQAGEGKMAAKRVRQAPRALRPGGGAPKPKTSNLKAAKERLAKAGPGRRRRAELDVARAILADQQQKQ